MKGKAVMYLIIALVALLGLYAVNSAINLQYSLLAQNASSIQGQIAANRTGATGEVNWTVVIVVLGVVALVTLNGNRLIRLYPRVLRAWSKSRPHKRPSAIRPAQTITLPHVPAFSPTPEPQEEVVEAEVNHEPQNFYLDF